MATKSGAPTGDGGSTTPRSREANPPAKVERCSPGAYGQGLLNSSLVSNHRAAGGQQAYAWETRVLLSTATDQAVTVLEIVLLGAKSPAHALSWAFARRS